MEPLFSIIVPVYNAQGFLDKCISSILSQSLADFELILIDDGSCDQSGEICDRYAKTDGRIHVFHQANAGVAAARNRGLKAASGTYITFVDSDDYLGKDYLENLSKSDADMVLSGHCQVKDNQYNEVWYSSSEDVLDWSKANSIEGLFSQGAFDYICSKRFRRSIIEAAGIRFSSKYLFGEDTVFNVAYLSHCTNVFVEEDTSYFYVRYDHETLSNRRIDTSYVQNLEAYTDALSGYVKSMFKERCNEIMNVRLGKAYKDVIYAVLHHPREYSYSFLRFVFKQRGFRASLCKLNEVYSEEDKKFRMILSLGSPVVMWLYLRYIELCA